MSADPATVAAWVQAANALGTIGVLIVMVVSFSRGDIIPKVIFDRVLQMYEKQLAELLKVFSDKLDRLAEQSQHRPPEFTNQSRSKWVDPDERRQ